jgi:2-amino-4-hydroxy-6-hydroxymethyldihydropteridine diphosphokinase
VTLAYVGIGSNLEEPRRQVESAFLELRDLPRTSVVKYSSLYRSEPVGYAAQPPFVNAVAALETSLEAPDLLHELQKAERRHGRRRSFANAPRTLDLDLLLYGQGPLSTPELTIPHPRMHQRAFVLKPLLELDPRISIPGIGAAEVCLRACAGQGVERMA